MLPLISSDSFFIEVFNLFLINVASVSVLRLTAALSWAAAEDTFNSDKYCDDGLVGISKISFVFVFIEGIGHGVRRGGGPVPCNVLLRVDRRPHCTAETWFNTGEVAQPRLGGLAMVDFVNCVMRFATIEGWNAFGGRTISCQSRIFPIAVGLFV